MPYLALTEEGEPVLGRFTITQGRTRKTANKAIAPVSWYDASGPMPAEDVLVELTSKIDLVLDDDEPGHLWVSAHLTGEKKPTSWHRIEGDVINLDPLAEFSDVHGTDRAFVAMTSVIGMLMQGIGEANALTLHNTRELGRVNAELMRAELFVALMKDADQSVQMQAALEALGPMLAPALSKLVDNVTRPQPAAAGTVDPGLVEPVEVVDLVPWLVFRVRSDMERLGLLAMSSPEAFTPEVRTAAGEVLAMVKEWERNAAEGSPSE